MPTNWSSAVSRMGKTYSEEDFKKAAYQLMSEQVLYEVNRQQMASYDLITSNLKDFNEAFELFGCRVERNADHRYVYAMTDFPRAGSIKLEQSLCALVLRRIYHQCMMEGRTDRGVATVELDEFINAYEGSTKRSLAAAKAGELKDMINAVKRHGIARTCDSPPGDPQPFCIEILPGIVDLMSEATVARLKAEMESSTDIPTDDIASADAGDEFEDNK